MPGTMALLLLSTLLSSPALAGLYTWTDKQGVVHYTDTRPANQTHQAVTLKPPSVVPMSENLEQGRRVSKIRESVSRSLDTPSRSRPSTNSPKVAAANEKQCAGYRKRLDRIQQQLRAGYSNDRGNSLRRQRRKVAQALSRECLLQ
ncbi:DUF4124 domain-containing protein [Marinobacter lipolyticus]|uniref:DUF4124 domain-containing protein n=1 Tax=Marinobacter lipolyticus TaxID=209639 RepID=UPI001BCFBC23|nr:DUF4124 domain-containing protein [Marinobacter lipolyticus]MBS8241136.1 DUF4124 domain-containing protein [Marinobacter lipolyticus]